MFDASRAFELPLNPPRPCIAVVAKGALILLPKSELERLLIGDSAAKRTKNMESAAALYRAAQAKRILRIASPEEARHGCVKGVARVEALGKASGLVINLLQAGNVAVVDSNTGKLVSQIVINYESYHDTGWGGGGSILAYLPNDWESVKSLPPSARLSLMQEGQRHPIIVALWWTQ